MQGTTFRRSLLLAMGCAVAAGGVSAQTVVLKPRTGRAAAGTAAIQVTRQGSDVLATIQASNSDARTLFRDLAAKSGTKILLGPAAAGMVTTRVEAQPLEAAIRSATTAAGMVVRRIVVPSASAAALTPETAAALAGVLTEGLTGATVVDPATGKTVSLTFTPAAPRIEAGQVSVYYVTRAPRTRQTASLTGDAAKDAAANATAALSELSLSDRMQAMREMQRQMFENMTPEEREQMRPQGGRGPGGPPPDGGMGGPPPDGGFGSNGGFPPPPPQ